MEEAKHQHEAGGEKQSLGAPQHRSVSEFLTDGSFVRLCAQLTHMTGLPIELRDAQGHAIVACDGPRPWMVQDEPSQPPPGADTIDITASGVKVGEIAVAPGEPTGPVPRRHVIEAVTLVAKTACEVIQHVTESELRIRELDVLYRLTSMLVRARGVERILQTALDSALDVMGLHAGSIVVIPEVASDASADAEIIAASEDMLLLLASAGLSRAWLEWPESLSTDRAFDKEAMAGDPVTVEDLRTDPRVQIPGLVESEGVRGFVTVGMRFGDRELGAIRLYDKQPRTFTPEELRLLQSIAQQAAVAVEQARLMETRRREQVHQRQLRLAADVQRRMLPNTFPKFDALDVAARYEPSLELAGDFYDVFEVDLAPARDGLAPPKGLGIVVGDVVGKGVPAALLMSLVRATLRSSAEHTHDLAEVVTRVNQSMSRDTLPNEFATLWFGVVDPANLRLWFCSAGHDPPMILRVPEHRAPSPADLDELAAGGLVVGIDPSQRYQVASCDLAPGDVLVAYSDGLTDARNFDEERYGKDRLRASLIKNLSLDPSSSANTLADQLMWDVRRFAGLTDRVDDQTLVALRVNK